VRYARLDQIFGRESGAGSMSSNGRSIATMPSKVPN